MILALKSIGKILQMLGERITEERLSQNITQHDLASRSGVAYSTLRKIESSGEGSMSNYVALLQALKLVDHQGVRTLRKTASQRVLADLGMLCITPHGLC